MSTDLIRYDLLVQDALKSVVRNVLTQAAHEGLPGEHHFCITFRTHAPGVRLSARVREQHPDEMTIILQHQFWDLVVTDHAFEVGLSFGHVPERLMVPFESVTGFWDPSVQFGLKFEVQEPAPQAGANDAAPAAPPAEAAKPVAKAATKTNGAEERPAIEAGARARVNKTPAAAKPAPKAREDAPSPAGEKVVSIDAFRKKP